MVSLNHDKKARILQLKGAANREDPVGQASASHQTQCLCVAASRKLSFESTLLDIQIDVINYLTTD
jgi:hypothetical protein